MPCGCKHKKGSGGTYLSGVTWGGYPKKGRGIVFRGGAFRKRRRKKKASGYGPSSLLGGAFRKRRKKKASGYGPTPLLGGAFRKRRRKKKSGGMSMTGGGVNFTGGAVNAAMRVVLNRFRNGRRVI